MTAEDLINTLRNLNISVTLVYNRIENRNKEYFATRFLLIQLKKFFEKCNIPQERFKCIIYDPANYNGWGADFAPRIIVQLILDEGRKEFFTFTREMLNDHIDVLQEYLRLEISDFLWQQISK